MWLRAIRPWLWLGVVLVMLVSVPSMLLLPDLQGRTVAAWVTIICTVEVGISRLADQFRSIRLDPEKQERFNRAWHTIGARILAAGISSRRSACSPPACVPS
jgi:hypothetical protein